MTLLLPETAWVIAKIRGNQILFFKTDKFHWKIFMGNLRSLFLSSFYQFNVLWTPNTQGFNAKL